MITIGELRAMLRKHGFLEDQDVIAEVISWQPVIDDHGIGWPTMRIDRHGQRRTTTPIWVSQFSS